MAFRHFLQISRRIGIQNFIVSQETTLTMYSHKHRKYVIDNRRNFASKIPEQKNVDGRPGSCPSKQSCGSKKDKKDTFWGGIFGNTKKKEEKKKPPIECCQLKQARGECKDDPDLSEFGGQPYRTCGSAYIIQKDRLPVVSGEPSAEDKILKKIETKQALKDKIEDPMPPFETVEKRLIELSQRKLHPFYKRYQTIQKKPPLNPVTKPTYKTRSGPICVDDLPVQLKYNKEILEKKNMFADYKRVQPPQQLVAKIIEMKKNEKPTLERKKRYPNLETDRTPPKRKAVYETLHQKPKSAGCSKNT